MTWYTSEMLERAVTALRNDHGGCTCPRCSPLIEGHARSVLDAIPDPRIEVGRHFEEALREDRDKWSFNALVAMARLLLDVDYPADVFTGESGDGGPGFVAKLRDALDALERPGSRNAA